MTKMNLANLAKREETPKRYDSNRDVNNLISKIFEESKESFTGYADDIEEVSKEEIKSSNEYRNIPYGGKTLGEAGCAVFCFEHGLRIRGIKCEIEELAKEIADKGYYLYGKGTYHNLFDHFGLRRITDVIEIFDSLKMGKVITILVKNSEYTIGSYKEGSHFVNIVGKKGEMFVIDDSYIGARIAIDIDTILKATTVAWIW